MSKSKGVGKATGKESHFARYLGECIAQYIEKHGLKRGELMAGLSWLCNLTFTMQTPLSVTEQCNEIDSFCNYLKDCALGYYDEV